MKHNGVNRHHSSSQDYYDIVTIWCIFDYYDHIHELLELGAKFYFPHSTMTTFVRRQLLQFLGGVFELKPPAIGEILSQQPEN